MKLSQRVYSLSLSLSLLVFLMLPMAAQQPALPPVVTVPRFVSFSSKAFDGHGQSISGTAGATFAIYKDQHDGAPLWIETQSIQTDRAGGYSVQLGTTKPEGLPLDLFSTGEARWLGVRINGGEEQPRVLLLSVPYALKAADAETVGGLPASAFVLATPPMAIATDTTATPSSTTPGIAPPPAAVTGSGTLNFLPIWTGAASVGNSALFQSGTGATAKVGIGTTTPSSTLDVKGSGTFRGVLTLPSIAAAIATKASNSQPLRLVASAFNSSTSAAVSEYFNWQTEPTGNNTAAPSGTLNLLFGSGATKPLETGLKIANNGRIAFAPGQTFPGTGPGTVTSVALSAPSSDFSITGSPITGSGTLALNWNSAPSSANLANTIVKRDATGSFTANQLVLNSNSADLSSWGLSITTSGSGLYLNSASFGIEAHAGAAGGYGVSGEDPRGNGVVGEGLNGVYGVTDSGIGVTGVGGDTGVYGQGTYGVYGDTPSFNGVTGAAHNSSSAGVAAINDGGGDALYTAVTNGGYAAFFAGPVDVDGNLSKSGGSFKIDHPLDPANKYLYHSFVESPDMKNIYDGTITTDAQGNAEVALPEWFERLNRDFRYQLTVIGQFAQAIVSHEIDHDTFSIKTDKPNVKVSWQVTGIRHDEWADAHRIPVEETKPEEERGFYLHPELFGAAKEKSVAWARHGAGRHADKDGKPHPLPVPPVRPLRQKPAMVNDPADQASLK
jgi:trimeric autotransporter adhesin